jgi:hypothetical protein
MVTQQLQFGWNRDSSSEGEAQGEERSVCQVATASERTEPPKGVTMEEVVRRENLQKALKRVCQTASLLRGDSFPFFPVTKLWLKLHEPPCTDPYARWCGRAKAVKPSPIPMCARHG